MYNVIIIIVVRLLLVYVVLLYWWANRYLLWDDLRSLHCWDLG
jgi:nitrogen fixation-related uncharacterized protein